jgi:hypothetical protein
VDIRVVTAEAVVVMGVVDMEEAEVVTMKVVVATLTTLGIIQVTAVKVTRATQDIIVMERENMDIMTKQVTVVITVITGDTKGATMMEEAIMGSIILGKKVGKVQNSVKVEDIRKGTPPRDLTRYTKRTSTRKTMSSTMNTTMEVTTASMEVMRAITARGAEVMKREDITSQVITMAITGRRVITLRAITTMAIRATKGHTDTIVTTATTPNMVVRVVPLADPATVTVAEVAGEMVVVTEVVEAMEAVVTEVVDMAVVTVVEAMEVVAMAAVVTEVADMAEDTVMEAMEVVATEAEVTEAVDTEVAGATEAEATEAEATVVEAMEVVVMEAVVTEVADMAEDTMVEAMEAEVTEAVDTEVAEATDMADMVGAMVVTVAVVTSNKYYKRGTRYLLLCLFNRVSHF